MNATIVTTWDVARIVFTIISVLAIIPFLAWVLVRIITPHPLLSGLLGVISANSIAATKLYFSGWIHHGGTEFMKVSDGNGENGKRRLLLASAVHPNRLLLVPGPIKPCLIGEETGCDRRGERVRTQENHVLPVPISFSH